MTSVPAPSAFALPRRRSHFPRIAFGDAHEDFRTRPVRVRTSAPAFTFPPHSLRRCPRRLPRPPCPRLHFRVGVHTSPAWPSAFRRMTSAPAPSAFALPCRRSHFLRIPFGDAHEEFCLQSNDFRPRPVCVHTSASAFTLRPHSFRRRPRRLWPSAAAVIHNGLSTEKLSTSLLATLCKTFSPSRLRTRIL